MKMEEITKSTVYGNYFDDYFSISLLLTNNYNICRQ